MKTVNFCQEAKIEIKKSIFISILKQIHNQDDFYKTLEEIRKKYPGANHYCYAYIIDDKKYSSDDKEPAKTAGLPILNVLERQGLNHICCIVVRFFGGIKLGSGGLVRAYSKAVQEVIKSATIYNYSLGLKISITVDYEQQKQLDYLLKDSVVCHKHFQEQVIYTVEVTKEIEELLQKNKILYTVIKPCFILDK